MNKLTIKRINKLPGVRKVYDLSVDETHNFFIGSKTPVLTSNCDGLTGDSQRALRNLMEEYIENVRFILTANYKNRISTPLSSRTQVFELHPPLNSCIKRVVSVLKAEGIRVSADQKTKLVELIERGYPDIRRILNDVERFTKNGSLDIDKLAQASVFPRKLFDMIISGADSHKVRQYMIENEVEFSNDYHTLLRGLFEVIYEDVEDEDKKRECMLLVGHYMEAHQSVMDFEINAYCCLLQLQKVLN